MISAWQYVTAVCICAIVISVCSEDNDAATKPHIIFILADDLGWNDVGFHGSELQTPFLDSLAASGVQLNNYYGHMICTPSRSSIMTGRYAFHTGLQHSYLNNGQDLGLPLKFKTLGDHMKEAGYSTHNVGKWHLGFQSNKYTPMERGFDSYYGYLGGGEDYYTHKTGSGVDLHDGYSPVFNATGLYSADLFANRTIDIIANHNTSDPLFLYLAFQSIHSPLEAPDELVNKFSWITSKSRRTLAGMALSMDNNIARIGDELKKQGMFEDTLFVFVADNGGPPYVANSNFPMRGGKWTIWEGGTHLTGLISGFNLPHKMLDGFMHHCDWVPTLVSAAGGTLNDTTSPPVDGIDMWASLMDPDTTTTPRTSVVMNIDVTNQNELNDPHGWSGYAGIRVGDWKLLLGDAGIPNGWCWPNQPSNMSLDAQYPPATLNVRELDIVHDPVCGMTQPNTCFSGDDIIDGGIPSSSTAQCCTACVAKTGCVGFSLQKQTCYLKRNIAETSQCEGGIAGLRGNGTDHRPISCTYNGTVPANRDQPLLFNLKIDPQETNNVAYDNPDMVATLNATLQSYVQSAVRPLNELPSDRKIDPESDPSKHGGAWMPWQDSISGVL